MPQFPDSLYSKGQRPQHQKQSAPDQGCHVTRCQPVSEEHYFIKQRRVLQLVVIVKGKRVSFMMMMMIKKLVNQFLTSQM